MWTSSRTTGLPSLVRMSSSIGAVVGFMPMCSKVLTAAVPCMFDCPERMKTFRGLAWAWDSKPARRMPKTAINLSGFAGRKIDGNLTLRGKEGLNGMDRCFEYGRSVAAEWVCVIRTATAGVPWIGSGNAGIRSGTCGKQNWSQTGFPAIAFTLGDQSSFLRVMQPQVLRPSHGMQELLVHSGPRAGNASRFPVHLQGPVTLKVGKASHDRTGSEQRNSLSHGQPSRLTHCVLAFERYFQ